MSLHRQPAIGFILVTAFLDSLGIGLLIPVAPLLVEYFRHGETSAGATTVGELGALYFFMLVVFAPVLGSLSDRFGRRPILLISMLGTGLDFFAMALAPTLPWLFLTRAINGMTGASMTVVSAYIADVTPPQKRAVSFALLGATFGLGFIIGPLIGGSLADIQLRLPFYVAGSVALLNWVYGLFVLPESLPLDRRRPITWGRTNPIGVFAGLKRYPLAAGLASVSFLACLAQFALYATWTLSMKHRFGWTGRQVGWSLTIVGIAGMVVQGGLARRIIPKLGEPRSLLFGMAMAAVAYLVYGVATHGWMIYVMVAVASLGAISAPASQSLVTRSVDPREQGEIQGAMTAVQSVAGIIGYPVGGALFGYFISEQAPRYIPGAPFYLGAVLCVLALGLAVIVLRKHAQEATRPLPSQAPPIESIPSTEQPAAAGEPG